MRGGVADGKGKSGAMPRSDMPSAPALAPPPPPSASGAANSQISAMARRLLGTRDRIVVEGFADRGDSDKNAASLARASRCASG